MPTSDNYTTVDITRDDPSTTVNDGSLDDFSTGYQSPPDDDPDVLTDLELESVGFVTEEEMLHEDWKEHAPAFWDWYMPP